MTKEFIPYELALALKELGFDEPCLANLIGFGDGTKENGRYKINQQQVFYPNDYTSSDDKAEELGLYPFVMCGVPLYQQAFRWFRENYQIVFCYEPCLKKDLTYIFFIYVETTGEKVFVLESKYNEEAERACLDKLIQIIKIK